MNEINRILLFFLITGRLEKQIVRLKSLYMKQLGLKGADLPVLLCLSLEKAGLRMEEICRLTALDKSQVSRSLTSCMNAGLIVSEEGRAYKKKYFLSQDGVEVCRILSQEAGEILKKSHADLDDESWMAFYGFMDILSDSLDKMITEMEKNPEKTRPGTRKQEAAGFKTK